MTLTILFWLFLSIILYTYIGYTLILLLLAGINRLFRVYKTITADDYLPDVTLLIPAYNEGRFVIEKVNNSLELDYPKEKLKIIWITDGTTDNSDELLCRYPEITVMHERERRGKIHAMNRGMKSVDTPLVIFTDANTMLNRRAIREITKLFADKRTGCVTGEKRISGSGWQKAVGAGEGLYWQYESLIKKLESETGSVMGAVGEIFAIRREFYNEVREDTLLDDFTISLHIIQQGHAIIYAPLAIGTETASLSIPEEIKRKVRIATGGLQALTRMTDLLNPFRYGLLSFKYFSHKVLRWTLVPFSFPIVFVLNFLILYAAVNSRIYTILFILQCIFYLLALAGGIMNNVKLGIRALFAPYYLFIMNYAVIKGFFRFITGNYSVKWQKVKRS
jgi:cellulose synthase/poly-beta-1,6-N-acetylglucosamine synthase-like glycosyltransferase